MNNHYTIMIIIMILSGLLSSMWIWSDKLSDIRLSLNDFYMIALMTSWMMIFMGMLDGNLVLAIISLTIVIVVLITIRTQAFISLNQFYTGMIPHHSMALLMSKRLLAKENKSLREEDRQFIQGIIDTQEREIQWMKRRKLQISE